jgi:predicted deacylase
MGHHIDRMQLKSPAPGTERYLTVHRFGAPGAGPKAYLQAALHADEWPGLMALNHLIPLLAAADRAGHVAGEIVVVPYANPVGMDQRIGGAPAGRYALDGSGNFNRNWPDLSAAAAAHLSDGLSGDSAADASTMRAALRAAVADLPQRTEVDALRATLLSLSIDADSVIDVHCDNESLMHIYCHAGHEAIGRALSAALEVPILLLEEEAGGFSFDDCHAGVWRRMGGLVANGESLENACFACTLELRGKDDVEDELGARDAAGLMRFLRHRGHLTDGPDVDMAQAGESYRLDEVDTVETPAAGLLAYKAAPGDRVSAGQTVAELIDLAAPDPLTARTPLVSRTDGLFFARVDWRLVFPGERIAKIAGRTPLAHRRQGALLED